MIALPRLRWVASPNYSGRTEPVRLIVAHDCEGSYSGAVSWFAQECSRVSAHYVLKEDGSEATQMVAEAHKAWHCCDFNSCSIGIEMGGFAERGFPEVEIDAMANVVAYLLHKHGLPPIWAKGGQGYGFCTHAELGRAGGGHKDFTVDPKAVAAFTAKVQAAHKAGVPASWPGER